MTLLTVKNVTKQYKDRPAVDQVSFTFEAGQTVALIGPNGAGKTTIMRMLAGLSQQTSGEIKFEQMQSNEDVRSIIGYLPQHPIFYSWMTGREFLVYSGELSYLSKSEAQKRADQLLAKVGIADDKDKRIGTYSGGMKQRLGIAQAIIHKPKLLLLDEPVSSLDPIGRRDVLKLMQELKREMTILFSTHILTDADQICDELLLLYEGKMVESGSMNELREKYKADKIELRLESNANHYLTKIVKLAHVTKADIIQDKILIDVSSIKQARHEILGIAAKENWPLLSLNVNEATLEDMFMKVVDQ